MQFDKNGELIVPNDYKRTITVSDVEKPGNHAKRTETQVQKTCHMYSFMV